MQKSAIRILLVDDHPALRQGLVLFLTHCGMTVLAEADTPQAALTLLASRPADLALVDLSFEREEGFALIEKLRAKELRVMVYSMHEDKYHVSQSLNCGADGYVSKREDSAVLLQGIDTILQGRRFLSPRAAKTLQKTTALSAAALPRCSARETEILGLLGQGLGNTEIAIALTLSVRTVETYCTRINEKLELSGMKELRRFALQHFMQR